MDTRKMRPILESVHYPIFDFLVLVIMMTSQLQKSFIESMISSMTGVTQAAAGLGYICPA